MNHGASVVVRRSTTAVITKGEPKAKQFQALHLFFYTEIYYRLVLNDILGAVDVTSK